MVLDAARLAASDGWLALDSARAVLAPGVYRFDGQRSPEDEARRRTDESGIACGVLFLVSHP
ncbi:MAG: hypothetical protein Q8L75_13170, partial [Acidobacteriota bacterium]|nr:hypothetical protein [Acidobacteriota bacterium]